MDKIEELKKIKQLLDEGIITEKDFINQKQKILGLKNSQKFEILNTNESPEIEQKKESRNIEEYEKELLEQKEILERKEKVTQNSSESTSIEKKENNDFYQKEKMKEKAKLEAKEEIRERRIEKRNKKIKEQFHTGKNIMTNIIKWLLTIFFIIFGLTGISMDFKYKIIGITFLLLAILTCPFITQKTMQFEKYTKIKKYIVIVLIIILLILFGS